MNNQQSPSMNFFVLADSHAKRIPKFISTSSYSLVTRSISGLSWINDTKPELSIYALLSSSDIRSSLSQADAVLFFVGTNSVRFFPAREIIHQVQQIIFSVQQNYPHLNQPGKISISLTFPCFYPLRGRFLEDLIYNIHVYNEQLRFLSTTMNFNILDFHITNYHLDGDKMHIQPRFLGYIINSITNHFDQVIETVSPPTLPTPPTPPASAVPDNKKAPQSSNRSSEALQLRNKKRHEKRKEKQQKHQIKRKIHYQWINDEIKQYLDSLNIKYAYIPPVYGNILRIQFNNKIDQDFADEHLGFDIFNENHYKEFVNKHH
ncbi:unnamed protein product [Adineta steineri]|uniref:Uncharacterized protein n=1 Tax=Adineta steineri TaxID=433720 RepID=A0A815MYW0_9BILA|nr:unnamed protein product [Adineta steineri]CAF1622852.1 unnamed protein product [Adineta steineri]